MFMGQLVVVATEQVLNIVIQAESKHMDSK